MAVVGFEDNLFKVLVVGDKYIGKTALIRRFVHNVFQNNTKATLGVDFALKVTRVAGRSVTMQIWDIAGQEQFGSLTRVYYQGASGALVAFDLSDPRTLEHAARWKKDIDDKVFLEDGSPLPCILVANKCDLSQTPINEAQMNAFCKKHNFIGWVETSSKTGHNVRVPFERISERVLESLHSAAPEETDGRTVRIDTPKPKPSIKDRCGC